jgi:hypothetical protein
LSRQARVGDVDVETLSSTTARIEAGSWVITTCKAIEEGGWCVVVVNWRTRWRGACVEIVLIGFLRPAREKVQPSQASGLLSSAPHMAHGQLQARCSLPHVVLPGRMMCWWSAIGRRCIAPADTNVDERTDWSLVIR